MAADHASGSTQHWSRTSFFAASGNAFTFMGWVMADSLPGAGEIHYIGGMNGAIACGISDVAGDRKWAIISGATVTRGTITPVVSTWNHVALVRESGGTVKNLYINGVLDATVSNAEAGATTLCIGSRSTADNGLLHWDGPIADFKVWDGDSLTENQVKREMKQYAPFQISTSCAWYPFIQVAVATGDQDYTANGRSLTLSGGPARVEGPPIPWRAHKQRRMRFYGPGFAAAGNTKHFLGLLGVGR